MIYIDIISAVPELFADFFNKSIIGRAQEKKLAKVQIHDLRDYAINKHKQIDDYAFGGGAGMVLRIEPIDKCLEFIGNKAEHREVIYLSPDGEHFDQPMANKMANSAGHLILLCGHYKGIDERVRENLIDREISIGDYVLSGGELAAAVVTDAILRLLPGSLGDESSALTDSFQDGMVAPPVYTRPAEYKGWKVPEVLISGHEKRIEEWRAKQSLERTKKRRPDNLNK
jgi:tRNA (guanine37-N1)-methyltransferase